MHYVCKTGLLILFFQMLMNVKWMKAAVRGTVATLLAATTASVLRAVDWGQMARHVTVRWTSGCWWCAQTQTLCSAGGGFLYSFKIFFVCLFVYVRINNEFTWCHTYNTCVASVGFMISYCSSVLRKGSCYSFHPPYNLC